MARRLEVRRFDSPYARMVHKLSLYMYIYLRLSGSSTSRRTINSLPFVSAAVGVRQRGSVCVCLTYDSRLAKAIFRNSNLNGLELLSLRARDIGLLRTQKSIVKKSQVHYQVRPSFTNNKKSCAEFINSNLRVFGSLGREI